MMTLRDLLNLPGVSLDSKIYIWDDEYCSFYHVTNDPETTDEHMICLLTTAELDEGEDEDED